MVSRGAAFVSVCYVLKNFRKCETISREDAYRLRKYVEDNGGVVYWFNPS